MMAQGNGSGCLYECLQEAHLERYHAHFVRYGISKCEGLACLSMQDYSRFGITRMEDRVRLFKLVQIVKSVQAEGKYCKHDNRYVPDESVHQFQQQKQAQIPNEGQRMMEGNRSRGQAFLQYVRARPTVRQVDNGPKYHAPPQPRAETLIATESVMAPARKKARTDSEVGVRYKPGTGSPIFNCRKILTFSDSEGESEDDEEEKCEDEREIPDTNSITDSEIRLKVLSTITTSGTAPSQDNPQELVATNHNVMRTSSDQHSHKPIRVMVPPPKSFYIDLERKTSQTHPVQRDSTSGTKPSQDNLFGHPTNRVVRAAPPPASQQIQETNVQSDDRAVNPNQRKRILQQETQDYGNISAELLAKKTSAQSKAKNQEFKLNLESDEDDEDVETDEYFALPLPVGAAGDGGVNNLPKETTAGQLQAAPERAQSLPTQPPLRAIKLGVQTQSVQIITSQPQKKNKSPEYNPAKYSPKQKKVISRIKSQPRPQCEEEEVTHYKEEPAMFSAVVPVTAHIVNERPLPKSAIMREARQRAMAEVPVHAYFPASQPSTSPMREPVVERVVHTKEYNYGVPSKPDTPGKHRTNGSSRNSNQQPRIKVCVRKRPLTRREQKRQEVDVASVDGSDTIIIDETKVAVDLAKYIQQHVFVFDEVFNESHSNIDVYASTAKPLVRHIFNKGCATCFAFGQTGAGKTYTLLGTPAMPGLYRLAAGDMFTYLQSGEFGGNLHLWVSYYEIYCSQLYDLLNKRKRLHVRENGRQRVCIAGLMETRVRNVEDVAQVVQYGNTVRSTGSTGVNPNSSRSHAVLQLEIRDSKDQRLGRLSFIDLAGSERAADVTEFDRQTRIEGAEINQSLLAALQAQGSPDFQLKECIRSLDQDSKHTPYRQSKLTHILRDSFVGNSRTCMIANISPSLSACENSLNTLRYADRVKELRATSNHLAMTTPTSSGDTPTSRPFNPALFHPSNIQFSSTPKQENGSQSQSGDMSKAFSEVYESPIRGHKIRKSGEMKKIISPQRPTRDSASPKKRSPGFEFTLQREGAMVNITTSRGSEPRSRESSVEAVRRGRSGSTGSFHSAGGKQGSVRKVSPQSAPPSRASSSTPKSTPKSGRKKISDGNGKVSQLTKSPQNNENSHSGGERRPKLQNNGRHSGHHTNDSSPLSHHSPPKIPSIKEKLMTLGDSDNFDHYHWGGKAGSRSARDALATSSSSHDQKKSNRSRASFIEDHRQILSHLDNIMDRAKAAIEKSGDEQSPQRPYSARTPRSNPIELHSPERPASADQQIHTRSKSLPAKVVNGDRRAARVLLPDLEARYAEGIAHRSKLYDLHNKTDEYSPAGINNPTSIEPKQFLPLEEDTESLEDTELNVERKTDEDNHMPDGHHFSPQREEGEDKNDSHILELHSDLDTTSGEESEEEDTTIDSDDLDQLLNEGEEYCLCENTQQGGKEGVSKQTLQKQVPPVNTDITDGHKNITAAQEQVSRPGNSVEDKTEAYKISPTEDRLNPRLDLMRETGVSTNTTPYTSLHHSNHDISQHIANIRSLLSVNSSTEPSMETSAKSSSMMERRDERSSDQHQSIYTRSGSMREAETVNQPTMNLSHSTDFLQTLADMKISHPVSTNQEEEDDHVTRLRQVNPALARLSHTFITPEARPYSDYLTTAGESTSRSFQPYHRARVPPEAHTIHLQTNPAATAGLHNNVSSETVARDITDSGIGTQVSSKQVEEEPEPVSTASTLDGVVSLSVQQEDEDTRWDAIRIHQRKLEEVVKQQSRLKVFDDENAKFTPIHPQPATHVEGEIVAPIYVHRRESNSSEGGEEVLNNVIQSSREERLLAGVVELIDVQKPQMKTVEEFISQTGFTEENVTPRSNASTSSGRSNGSAIVRAQQLVLAAHEEQLAEITALCKQEMKILVAVKNGDKTFDEYVQLMEQLLSSKAATIATLRSQVAEFVNHPVHLSASNTPR